MTPDDHRHAGEGAQRGTAAAMCLPQEAPREAPPPRRPGRLYVVDGLRLLSALMVAVHHYTGTARVQRPGNPVWGQPVSHLLPGVFPFTSYGWIGVEFFFVISGFVICMTCWGRRPRDFFLSRVVRLYPAYCFAVVFTSTVVALWPVVFRPLLPTQDLLNLSMLQQGLGQPPVDGVYWTLWSELRFYLVFLLVVARGLTYRRVVVFTCVWGTVAAFAPTSGIPFLVSVADPDSAWFFIAGLTLYLIHRFGPNALLWCMLGMAWVMSQHELVHRVQAEGVSSWSGALVLYTAFLGVMLYVALGRTDHIRWRWLATAGALTYPLYLLHGPAGLTAIHYLHSRVPAPALVTGLLAAALALSWLVHHLVEEPLSRLLKQGLRTAWSRTDRLPTRD